MRYSKGTQPVIGILGGGQLAGMLTSAASRLGCSVKIFEREGVEPISALRAVTVHGDWNKPDDLPAFAAGVDAVTLENEFIAPESLRVLEEGGHDLVPSSRTMSLIQDKLTQKRTLQAAGLPVPDFLEVNGEEDIRAACDRIGMPMVLKRRQMSYDGKGNALLSDRDEARRIWDQLNGSDGGLFAEAFCDFERELATIVIRTREGNTHLYPVVETVQRNHICHQVTAPARLADDRAHHAGQLARRAVESVEGVGAFGVEMFLLKNGETVINELAPRVHNSGHYTIEACETSQFENHIRVVLGRSPGSTAMRRPGAAMVNILGNVHAGGTPHMDMAARDRDDVYIHIYGKEECRPGRKMGHVTALGDTPEEALERAARVANTVRFE